MNIDFLIDLGIEPANAEIILAALSEELDTVTSDYERRRLEDKYRFAVESALERAGARNTRAAAAVLSYEWDGDDFDGMPSGLSDAVLSLKDSMPFLFGSDETKNETTVYTFVGISPVDDSDDISDTGELSYSEYIRLYR